MPHADAPEPAAIRGCPDPVGARILRAMGLHTTGRVHAIFDAKQVTERFRKREFVLELEPDSRYPQFVQFQLTGDRCSELDAFSKGDDVTVEFSLRGREWTSPQGEIRYFNSLDVWEIARGGAAAATGDEPPLPDGPPPGFDDDVPF